MNDYLTRAIRKLRPTAEFSIVNSDYSTIKWDVLKGDAPTLAEIEIAIEQVKADELAHAEAKANAKSALLKKLGITQDEANLLLE